MKGETVSLRKEFLIVGLLTTILTVVMFVQIFATREARTAPPIPDAFVKVTGFGVTNYQPETVTVLVGDTVAWTNIHELEINCYYTINEHTVTSDTGLFHGEFTDRDRVWTYTFNEVGVFGYHCDLHPEETGKIIVVAEEPEPVVAEPEPVVAEPEPVVAEPEPVVEEPEPVVEEPEPVVVVPEPVVVVPEPVVVVPEPVVVVPEPVVVEPEPVASPDDETQLNMWLIIGSVLVVVVGGGGVYYFMRR